MWDSIIPDQAKANGIFIPVKRKAESFGRPWSVAELKLTTSDLQKLKQWFEENDRRLANSTSDNSWAYYEYTPQASMKDVIGVLLLCLGSEYCRDYAPEDSIWPAFRETLNPKSRLYKTLFDSNGQPNKIGKDVFEQGARALNMRHAFDSEEEQRWYITVKLQFGFTIRGAESRLTEWLYGQGVPIAVSKLLENDPYSFGGLWKALKQYQANRIVDHEIHKTLSDSPWVRNDWIQILLDQASRKPINNSSSPDIMTNDISKKPALQEDIIEGEFHPITKISLYWPIGKTPQLRMHLDRDGIQQQYKGLGHGELDFWVDGQKVSRWKQQRDGSYSGDDVISLNSLQVKHPVLRPESFSISNGSGELIESWDLDCFGLFNDVLLFDLDSNFLLQLRDSLTLKSKKHYAIICDKDFIIEGCDPLDVKICGSSKALRLPENLTENLRVTYEGFDLWLPLKNDNSSNQIHTCRLGAFEGEPVRLSALFSPNVSGLPGNISNVSLLVNKKPYLLDHTPYGWTLAENKNIELTPRLLKGEIKIKVKFEDESGKQKTVAPEISIQAVGAAAIIWKDADNKEKLYSIRSGDVLERNSHTPYIRVWPKKDIDVMEASIQVGKPKHNKIQLRDFPGLGGEVILASDGEKLKIGACCRDSGCIKNFEAPMLRNNAKLILRSECDPKDKDFTLWAWPEDGKDIRNITPAIITKESKPNTWILDIGGNPVAIAIAWRGIWRGAWCCLDGVRKNLEIESPLSLKVFATCKWLRVPILHHKLESAFQNAVRKAPGHFLSAWFDGVGLPPQLEHDSDTSRYNEPIARHFLWNFAGAEAVYCDNSLIIEDACIIKLNRLSEVSRDLLCRQLVHCSKCIGYQKEIIKKLLAIQTDTPLDTDAASLRKRLKLIGKNALGALPGVSPENLEEMADGSPLLDMQEMYLALGQNVSSRKYIVGKTLLRILPKGSI